MRESPHDEEAQYVVSGALLKQLWQQLNNGYEVARPASQEIIKELQNEMAAAKLVVVWNKLRDGVRKK